MLSTDWYITWSLVVDVFVRFLCLQLNLTYFCLVPLEPSRFLACNTVPCSYDYSSTPCAHLRLRQLADCIKSAILRLRHESAILRSLHEATSCPGAGQPCVDDIVFDNDRVAAAWPRYVEQLSLWQMKRYFNKVPVSAGFTVSCKTVSSIVVVHPAARFTAQKTQAQWVDASKWALMGFCNFGEMCTGTFQSVRQLEGLPQERVLALMEKFVSLPASDRRELRMTDCPPHVRKNWHLAKAREQRREARRKTVAEVGAAAAQTCEGAEQSTANKTSGTTYVFDDEEEGETWRKRLSTELDEHELRAAQEAWSSADKLCSDDTGHAHVAGSDDEDKAVIVKRMLVCMTRERKWKTADLHDAVVLAGCAVPKEPSMRNYFRSLLLQFGDKNVGFMPQYMSTNNKTTIKNIIGALTRTQPVKGGKTGNKEVVTDRLATILNGVLQAGRETKRVDHDGEQADGADSDTSDDVAPPNTMIPRLLLPHAQPPGELPADALVTPLQAESALGVNQATDHDDEMLEVVDQDQRMEEEALMGRVVNPAGVDYSCLAVQAGTQTAELVKLPEKFTSQNGLRRADFTIDGVCMRNRLQGGMAKKTELPTPATGAGDLDPTQAQVYHVVDEWTRGQPPRASDSISDAPPLRFMLLGTAGTGKTHTARSFIRLARAKFGCEDSVLVLAHSGVAAANIGVGARTIDSLFHTNSEGGQQDLKGDHLDDLVKQLKNLRMLVIDEISTVGAAQLEIVHRRLEQVGKALGRMRGVSPDVGFGGYAVVLIGDFGQLPPVLSTSLLPDAPIAPQGGIRALAMAGKKRFQEFRSVIRLRRVHRMPGADLYKESTLRLRDAAFSQEDYDLWCSHDLLRDGQERDPHWPGSENLIEEALHLVMDNAQAGTVNGKRLVDGVPCEEQRAVHRWAGNGEEGARATPTQLASESVVVRCMARSDGRRAHMMRASEFRNVRKAIHLRVGARVMLTANRIWESNVVPLQLMNGARGIVVAILFDEEGTARLDGQHKGGTGVPMNKGNGLPKTLGECPLPQTVIVHFPEYTGPELLPGLPRTWVPVPTVLVRNEKRNGTTRVGLPLKLAWAMTVHKAQGITEPQGTVISFEKTKMTKPASRMGLALVAWTRATDWSRVAFRGLPPMEEFLEVRRSVEFRAREKFEAEADRMHDAYLLSRGVTSEQQVLDHVEHLRQKVMRDHNRGLTEYEITDMRSMLERRGVAPVAEGIARAAAARLGRERVQGMWSIVQAFRKDRKPRATGKGAKGRKGDGNSMVGVARAVLQEHGYAAHIIDDAIQRFGGVIPKCVEYCLKAGESEAPPAGGEAEVDPGARATPTLFGSLEGVDNAEAISVMRELGFSENVVLAMMREFDSSGPDALRALLLGRDLERARHASGSCFMRHGSLKTVISSGIARLCDMSVRNQYEARVREDLGRRATVVDLGQYAAGTSGACFWLCLAAGLSRCDWAMPEDSHAFNNVDPGLMDKVAAMTHEQLDVGCNSRVLEHTAVGDLALRLRRHFCAGADAVLLRPEAIETIFPAFALMGRRTDRAGLKHYQRWVSRLAETEYADELVINMVVRELGISLRMVPFTPSTAASSKFKITEYPQPPDGSECTMERDRGMITMGNNDIHFVWLMVSPQNADR